MTKNCRTGLCVLIVLCMVSAAAFFTGGFFDYKEVCKACGKTRDTCKVYWVPFRSEEDSLLSRYIASRGTKACSQHEWLFCSGGGGSIACAIGDGRFLYPAIDSEEIIVFLQLAEKYGGPNVTDMYIRAFLRPGLSRRLYDIIDDINPAITDKDSFIQNQAYIDGYLGVLRQ